MEWAKCGEKLVCWSFRNDGGIDFETRQSFFKDGYYAKAGLEIIGKFDTQQSAIKACKQYIKQLKGD